MNRSESAWRFPGFALGWAAAITKAKARSSLASSFGSDSNRLAKLAAFACTNGSFMKNNACVGTVVAIRSRRAGVGVRAVEQRQERMPLDPLHHQVNAAPVVIIDRRERGVLREAPTFLRRKRVALSRRAVEIAADRENRVANLLGAQSPAGKSPQPDVMPRPTRPLIGSRTHDQPMHCLDRPAGLDELRRQPVEQFGMRGRLPRVPKSFGVATSPVPK